MRNLHYQITPLIHPAPRSVPDSSQHRFFRVWSEVLIIDNSTANKILKVCMQTNPCGFHIWGLNELKLRADHRIWPSRKCQAPITLRAYAANKQ